jgi:hypothetical protein
MNDQNGILGGLIGTANLKIEFDNQSLIKAGFLVLGSGVILIFLKKLIDKLF